MFYVGIKKKLDPVESKNYKVSLFFPSVPPFKYSVGHSVIWRAYIFPTRRRFPDLINSSTSHPPRHMTEWEGGGGVDFSVLLQTHCTLYLATPTLAGILYTHVCTSCSVRISKRTLQTTRLDMTLLSQSQLARTVR